MYNLYMYRHFILRIFHIFFRSYFDNTIKTVILLVYVLNFMVRNFVEDSDVFVEQKSGSGRVWGLLFGFGINILGTSPLGFRAFGDF